VVRAPYSSIRAPHEIAPLDAVENKWTVAFSSESIRGRFRDLSIRARISNQTVVLFRPASILDTLDIKVRIGRSR
jgi:hypothetical protein